MFFRELPPIHYLDNGGVKVVDDIPFFNIVYLKEGVYCLIKMRSEKHNNVKIKSPLFDTIFLSEKRKNVLFLLKEEGPKSSDDIKDEFDFPWKSMSPQIKKLIEWKLVLEDNNRYILSDMGSIITSNMQSFLNTLYSYEQNLDFWSDHDLSSIPPHLLSRIGELGNIEIIERDISKLFVGPKEVLKSAMRSKRVLGLSSIFYPSSTDIYYKLMGRNIEVLRVLTTSVLETMQTEYKDPLCEDTNNSVIEHMSEYKKRIKNILEDKRSNIMVYEDKLIPAFMVITDEMLLLNLMDKNGRLSTKYLIASEPQALIWAEELFMYYVKRSKPLSLFCDSL